MFLPAGGGFPGQEHARSGISGTDAGPDDRLQHESRGRQGMMRLPVSCCHQESVQQTFRLSLCVNALSFSAPFVQHALLPGRGP